MVFIGNILYQSVTKCNKIVYLEKKSEREEKKRNKSDKWFYIEILVYPSVTNCNKTAYLEKKSEREEKTRTPRRSISHLHWAKSIDREI